MAFIVILSRFLHITSYPWKSPRIDPSRPLQYTKIASSFRQLVMDPLAQHCMSTDESDPVPAAWTVAPPF